MPAMTSRLLQTLMASVTVLELLSVWALSGGNPLTWPHAAAVPLVVERSRTVPLSQPDFQATLNLTHASACPERPICGIQCQRSLPKPGRIQLERVLAYETLYANGSRTLTEVHLRGTDNDVTDAQSSSPSPYAVSPQQPPNKSTLSNNTSPDHTSSPPRPRQRRQVFGADGRFVISDQRFATSFPFSASVKLSSGCSGILVAPRHVLTAAHCVHDGQDYLKESRGLRVGVMRSRVRRSGAGAQKKGGGRKRGAGEERERGVDVTYGTEGRANGSAQSTGKRREQKRGRGKRRREKARNRRGTVPAPPDAPKGTSAPADPEEVSFRWARVKQIHIPRGWMKAVSHQLAPDYDYALLELQRRPPGAMPMELGLLGAHVKQAVPAGRVHFTGFDQDQPGRAVYRFCSVSQESDDLLYQHCDARAGASGAGVYVRLREASSGGPDVEAGRRRKGKAGVTGKWARKVIGVFSGHQWVTDDNGAQRDYNVAVRITPAKYAQICHWIHADPKDCQQL